ncbi:hypothetical protein GmHk_12G033629 [Glycine max]|nr:hypothetical protein GmHk_12G033629 [Glycine max]
MHNDAYIIPNTSQQVIHTAAMLEPLASAAADVDMLRHAVDVCQRITKSLKHMINMRMVTAGIEAYTPIEHYLRLARGVTEQQNIYIR